jgi:hypothetical protein
MSSSDFSIDLSSLPHDQYPLSNDEQTIFNTFFLPEYQERQKMMSSSGQANTETPQQNPQNINNTQDTSEKPKRGFFKKLLIALIAVAILFLHTLTPLGGLLKALTAKPMYAVFIILVYAISFYFLLEKLY